MEEMNQASNGGLGIAFLLSEMRDLRKGMESRDARINGSLDGLREDVSGLSAKVDRSQGDVEAVRGDMEKIRKDLHGVRVDVDVVMEDRHTEKVRKESAWSGPAKIFRNLAIVGAGLGGALALFNLLGLPLLAYLPFLAP
jgi:uncharacterized protein (DUF3084 family)